ncbi:MAG: hypothetical protein ACRCYC_09355 [Paraclostridium sp.]|uniref:hypothetical protein n=1 Tax=Paraclostridium sp. TaxID=2023273 RepID=UPI003F3652C2
MDAEPLIGISYELIFQIFNTLLIFIILGVIGYGIYCLIAGAKYKKKYENKIIELEKEIKELQEKPKR